MVQKATENGLDPGYLDKIDKALQTTYTINMFHAYLLKLFQYQDFDLKMMIQPHNYQHQWKNIIIILIYFINYKDVYEPKHHDIALELEKAINLLKDESTRLDENLLVQNGLNRELKAALGEKEEINQVIEELVLKNGQNKSTV